MRLVDADMLIKTIPTEEINARMAIAAAPTIEAEPKHGRWIDRGSGQECSVCGEIQYGYDSYRNYCAFCGADMRGGENE